MLFTVKNDWKKDEKKREKYNNDDKAVEKEILNFEIYDMQNRQIKCKNIYDVTFFSRIIEWFYLQNIYNLSFEK